MESCRIIQNIHKRKYKKLISELVKKDCYFLDIGFGFGYLKPLVESHGANYFGIDPRRDGAVEYAKKNYGEQGFVQGYFPEANTLTKKELNNGVIISLTTIDEVVDQNIFLKEINNLCSENTKVYIAVRNSDWFFFRKKMLKTIDGYEINDFGLKDYQKKFRENGFDILRIEKSSRPLLTSFSFNGFKTLIIVLLDKILPTERSYMLGFLLKKNIND
jgi:hypothetical protein